MSQSLSAALVLHSSIVASKPLSTAASALWHATRCGSACGLLLLLLLLLLVVGHRHCTSGVDSAGGGVCGRQAAGRPAAEDRVERAAAAAAWQSVRTSPASGRNESKRHE